MPRARLRDPVAAVEAPLLDPAPLRRLPRARDRMDAASHEAWPVERLAQVSGVSVAYLARGFKRAFGLPPHRYLLTRRVEQAIALLRDTELPITDIAYATGWQSLGTFGRIFRDVTGGQPRRHARAGPGRPGGAGPHASLCGQGCAAPRPEYRSFGEALPPGKG